MLLGAGAALIEWLRRATMVQDAGATHHDGPEGKSAASPGFSINVNIVEIEQQPGFQDG